MERAVLGVLHQERGDPAENRHSYYREEMKLSFIRFVCFLLTGFAGNWQ